MFAHVDFQMSLDIFQFDFEIFRPLGCIIPVVSVLHFKGYVCAKACRGSTCGVRTAGYDPLDIHGYAEEQTTTTFATLDIWCHIGHLPHWTFPRTARRLVRHVNFVSTWCHYSADSIPFGSSLFMSDS